MARLGCHSNPIFIYNRSSHGTVTRLSTRRHGHRAFQMKQLATYLHFRSIPFPSLCRYPRCLMRCIAHIWNSFDCDGNQLLLCISPLNSTVGGAPVEAFASERLLCQRLREIGVQSDFLKDRYRNLQDKRATTWGSIDVSPQAFQSFGRATVRRRNATTRTSSSRT